MQFKALCNTQACNRMALTKGYKAIGLYLGRALVLGLQDCGIRRCNKACKSRTLVE